MSTRSLNMVQLIGNLTRDPELRYTPQGTAVCSLGLATNRTWMTESGERKEDVEFHRIVAWAKLAELCAQLLFKGRKVYVQGRLQTRQWTGQDGAQRSTTEVVIDDMMVLDSRMRGEETGGRYEEGGYQGQSAGGSYAADPDYVDDYIASDPLAASIENTNQSKSVKKPAKKTSSSNDSESLGEDAPF